MGKLEKKVALITGAGSGIGKATAKKFADEGAQVVVQDFNKASAEEVSASLTGTVSYTHLTLPTTPYV